MFGIWSASAQQFIGDDAFDTEAEAEAALKEEATDSEWLFVNEFSVQDLTVEDIESCSWCVVEVPDRMLREVRGGDGARVCPDCVREAAREAARSVR